MRTPIDYGFAEGEEMRTPFTAKSEVNDGFVRGRSSPGPGRRARTGTSLKIFKKGEYRHAINAKTR